MNRLRFLNMLLAVAVAVIALGMDNAWAVPPVTGPGSTPDYYETPNWANSPPLRKFVDTLPGLGASAKNNLNQYLPIAIPDTTSYQGSDYYEIELGQFTEQMHSDLPPTTLRGYRQTNTNDTTVSQFHYLGPLIIAQKDRPVRIKFTNKLGTGAAGNLFLPVDTTVMGSGEGPLPDGCTPYDANSNTGGNCEKYTQNRATLHLHGGRTPWISDGTPHQWIAPAGENTSYKTGVSVVNVPDMWFDSNGVMITEATYPGSHCAGLTTCDVNGATNDPGDGSQTFYWTNKQSSRLMFYHDHAWGITRLNVYAGEAAGYMIQDCVELAMINGGTCDNKRVFTAGTIPADQIPLVIQDKTFVDGDPASPTYVRKTDPTWNWGTGTPDGNNIRPPVTGDLWWPHVYMPAENPYNPDMTGTNPMGRWFYGPWFYPATPVCGINGAALPLCVAKGPVTNPWYDPNCDPAVAGFCQPPEIPGTPNVSWGAEAFLDTMIVNGTAYPSLTVQPKAYRLRILNAAHDRFLNLQLYQADTTVPPGCPTCAADSEVKMIPALDYSPTYPTWPADAREGGVPDPALRGPAWIQIGTEGGFLPAPVVLPNQPITWNLDPTTFNFGNVNGGTLILGPAERGDVIVDFTNFAGKTLILYNDAPTAFPALIPQYNYYTGAPDRTGMGGAASTPVGFGPNIRTVMQIKVAGSGGSAPPDDYNPATLAALQDAFKTTAAAPGAFQIGQEPVVVGQTAYNSTYNMVFPATWPNWGISRITDTQISFKKPDGTMATQAMLPKAIHDEMGASFDEYGRMAAKLGLEMPAPNANNANFLLQNYVDPPTEVASVDAVQIWKITHNGVDTHPIHFHLFDVQVLNRVGWDGIIRLPDANELGWKDTVRISPLEDTIVALRPVLPSVPFPLPDSIRPLNPAVALGSPMGFSQTDPRNGGQLGNMVNQMLNFGHEYVWHCHILSHEENDMMRSILFQVPPAAPSTLMASVSGGDVQLSFIDNSANENAFIIEKSLDPTFPAGTTTQITVTSTTSKTFGTTIPYTDTGAGGAPNYYRVRAVDNYFDLTATPAVPAVPVAYNTWKAQPTYSGWSNIATVGAPVAIAIVNPTSLAFGNQPVGVASAAKTVTLTNSGGADLNIASITLTGTNAGDYAISSNTCGATLTPLTNCTVSVTFAPTVAAARAASLTITSNDPLNATLDVPLSGTGTSAPIAGVSPALLTFAAQLVTTTSAAQVVTLSNTGNIGLNITSIALTGANVADYAQTNNCISPLAAGASCSINVTFTPAAIGARMALIAIKTDDPANPTLNVTLSGTGIASTAAVIPASVTFGPQMVKTTSAATGVTLSNQGTAPLVLNGISFSGINAADFAQTNTCVSPLTVGGSCTISLTFTPNAVGTRSASLSIASSDPIRPVLNVPVIGTGAGPVASITPASLAFGTYLVNTASPVQSITVTNTSTTTALAINSIAVTGTDAVDFSQTTTCGASLATGASCTVDVTFAPKTQGAKTAAVTISTNDPANGVPVGTFTVALTGLGSSITLSSQALLFGAQVINTTSASQAITIMNTGTAPMTISSISVTGANSLDFLQTNNCPTRLSGNSSCRINVRFRPTAAGPRTANMTITDSAAGSPQTVPMNGTGLLGPAATLAPATINFGTVTRGTTSAAQTITLSSTGGAPLIINRIRLNGNSPGDFILTNNNCPIGGAGLAAGATCTVSVQFRPTRRTGTRTATVDFTDNANNVTSTQRTTLSGVSR